MIKRFDTEIAAINHSGKVIIKVYHEDKVYYNSWYILDTSAREEINTKFGSTDGPKVINAAQQYIKSLGKEKGSNLLQFINEDPMMVCSLPMSEYLPSGFVMPKRYLVGDGNSWTSVEQQVNTGTDDIIFEMYYDTAAYTWDGIFIYDNGSSNGMGIECYDATHLCVCYGGYAWAANATVVYTSPIAIYLKHGDGCYVNGVKTNGTYRSNILRTQYYAPFGCFYYSGSTFRSGRSGRRQGVLEHRRNNETIHLFVPFISSTRQGQVDIVTMEFHPNLGTGNFTDEYLRNGQPWTPSTP